MSQVQKTLKHKSSKVSDGSALRFILEEFEMKLTTVKASIRSQLNDMSPQVISEGNVYIFFTKVVPA